MASADTILVLGHRGLLGRAVVEACGRDCLVIEGGRRAFDLGSCGDEVPAASPAESVSPGQARGILDELRRELPGLGPQAAQMQAGCLLARRTIAEIHPSIVINCAGYTDVDRAESEPELALAVNGAGAGAVAQACAEVGAHLVHISTDYVFDGRARRPYGENASPRPLSAYGRSKLEGERQVRAALAGALIVRSAWLFGPGRPGFVDKVLARARRGQEVRVVTDQVGSPTYTRDLARALVELARRRVSGLVHLVNQGQASRFELARQCLRLAGLDPELVRPVTTAEMGPVPAPRPAYSVLEGRRAARLLGAPLPTWLDALRRYLAETESGPS